MSAQHRTRLLVGACAGLLILAAVLPAAAANVVLVNLDAGTGQGLDDPTPAAPVGGNPGTTLGEQRVNVYNFAAQIWGATLDSDVPILVGATFVPLPCSSTGGVLGAAGPTQAFINFPGAGFANTIYVAAEADALAGFDLGPGNIDIISFFNSDIDDDDPNCLTGRTWYYGFDNDQGERDFDFLTVVLHEINHGLGHLELVDETTGALLAGFPDIYTKSMLDLTLNATWDTLTDAERLFSQTNTNNLVWNGTTVTGLAPSVLGPAPIVAVEEPEGIGDLEALPAPFGPAFPGGGDSDSDSDEGVEGDLVLADDGVGTGSDACEAVVNDVDGKIALVDRGACSFAVQVANVEAAGAIAAVIANNVPGGVAPLGGSDPSIAIPSAGISQADGDTLKAALAGGDDDSDSDSEVEVEFGFSATQVAGTSQGFVRLFAPNPVQPGSSKSHWDITADPSLLMEPRLTPNLESAQTLDLSPALLDDIGWPLLVDPSSGGGSGGDSGGDSDSDSDSD